MPVGCANSTTGTSRGGAAQRVRLPAPAKDDEVRLLLGGSLDDSLGGVTPDADDGMDRRSLGRKVEDALEEAPRMPGASCTFREGHAFWHLDDAQRGEVAGTRIEERRAKPDELLGCERVRDRDQDPGRERGARGHQAVGRPAAAAGAGTSRSAETPSTVQRSIRYGFSSSNSRAWRSTRSSAWSVVNPRFSITKLPTRPK